MAKQAFMKHQAQLKGYQFRFKEKAFLAYLRKYPLYVQKSQLMEQRDQHNTTATMGSTSFQSARSEVGGVKPKAIAPGKVGLKVAGFGSNRIEEDKDEDEDDSSSQKQTANE